MSCGEEIFSAVNLFNQYYFPGACQLG